MLGLSGLMESDCSVGRPTAFRIAPLIAYTVPSGPMIVGVYASPIPGESVTTSESKFVLKFHRYSFPSSLLTITDIVNGSTAAVLMHHSRTAFGNWLMNSGSGV